MTDRPDVDDGVREIENSVARCYSTWGETYYRDYYGVDAPYPPVHRDLILSLVRTHGAKRVIDAGCGPASILRHLVAPERDLYGFDLTPEMIVESQRVMSALGVAPARLWLGSVLDQEAFKSPDEKFIAYDCALCIGVLPHVPEGQEITLIENLREAVRSNGLILIEGRNELFSLFTMNRYSHDFFVEQLIRQDELLHEAADNEPALRNQLAGLKAMFRTDIPLIRKGLKDEPGYDEIVSRLHNPMVLAKQIEGAGFHDVRTLFYHFHCLPPMFGLQIPKLFRERSLAMEQNPQDWRGYFMASAFIIAATRT
jgi:2-polyprenyl-3-methyl-5-hydroxy-6-metoxy-1,4-benzoquinol methylase